MIRAKMQVSEVTLTGYSERVKLHAVYSDVGEDNSYSKATPSASLDITIDNPKAQGKLRPGQKYYVDFSSADLVEAKG